MRMFGKVFAFGILLMLFMLFGEGQADCYDNKSCGTCAGQTYGYSWLNLHCRWCPLTKACHAAGSLYNHCPSDNDIHSTAKCPTESSYTYNAAEANKLALFSAVAYSSQPANCSEVVFPGSDYRIDRVLKRNCDENGINYHFQCTAIIAYSVLKKEVIVAFRGTKEVQQLIDQVLNILTNPAKPSPIGGNVQQYFNSIHEKFYEEVKNVTTTLKANNPGYKFKITGHSLGGAVASITSAMLVHDNVLSKDEVSLYVFGMPRAGDKLYALAHETLVPNSWRVVRDGDVVDNLPPAGLSYNLGPYHHATKVSYDVDPMAPNSPYVVCKGNEDSHTKCLENGVSGSGKKRRKRFVDLKKHTHYFGFQVGEYCNSKGFARK